MERGSDLRNYLAAERTLLVWIRTGLALMGFGFVVARFGFFLQQLQIAQHAPAVQPHGLSLWFGTALIGASVAVNLLSVWHHVRLVRSINPGQGDKLHSTSLAVSTSLFLVVVGLAMAIYLGSVRGSANIQYENSEEKLMVPGRDKGIINKAETVEKFRVLYLMECVSICSRLVFRKKKG